MDKTKLRTCDIVTDLRHRIEARSHHAQNMLDAANNRANMYPNYKSREERIARHWSNELAAYQKVYSMLDSMLKQFEGNRQLPTGLACRLVTDPIFETVTIGWLTSARLDSRVL